MVGPFPKNEIYCGVSNGIYLTLKSNIIKEYNIKYIATSYQGIKLRKIAAMALGLCKFFAYIVFTDIKLVHIVTASWLSFYRKAVFIFIGKVFRKKLVLEIQSGDFYLFYAWGPKFNRWIITKILDRVDTIIALSERLAIGMKKKTTNNNIKIRFNSVDTSIFSSQIYKSKKSVESNNVIFIGRLSKKKGIYDLLEAIPLVIKRKPSTMFILCGKGDIEDCKKICKEKGINDHVEFLGWIDGQNKIDVICSADVFVLPSYFEALPNAIIEAMAAGLPIISTNVGGIPDIIQDGVNGFLVQPGDIQAIADRILKLLADKALREKIGERNSMKAKSTFDVNVVIEQLCQIYHELLEDELRPRPQYMSL